MSMHLGFNTPLARKVIDQIIAVPEEWNQEDWRCGSGMCFAGWAIELSGYIWAWPKTFALGNDMVVISEEEYEELSIGHDEVFSVDNYIGMMTAGNAGISREEFERRLTTGIKLTDYVTSAASLGRALMGQTESHGLDCPHAYCDDEECAGDHELDLFDADNSITTIKVICEKLSGERFD